MLHPLSSAAADNNSAFRPSLLHDSRNVQHATSPRASGRTTLSLGQVTTYRQSFARDVLECEAVGLRRIGVWRRKLDEFGLDRAVELLQYHFMTVSSLSWGGGFTGRNGMTYAEAVDDTRLAIDEATQLGAHALTIVSGPRGGHIRSHARRTLIDGLDATIDFAADHGVTLALQPMAIEYSDKWTFLDSLEEALEIVRWFDHPFLGLAVGTCHLWQEPHVLERLQQAAPYVATVQLSDWRCPRQDDDRLLPGAGEIPLASFIAALEQGGYHGDYELDVWSRDLWKTSSDDWLSRTTTDCANLIAGPQSRILA